ncbi:MAG: TolC family protein [Treponema sp.]|jgi:outer membrane protein TolC|nr:TolC family protein [Treponema sp.]
MNLKKRNIDKRKISCLAVTGLLLCANLTAQEAPPVRLSSDRAVEMALNSNLSLESSRISAETKRRASQLSWNQFIPNVMVAGRFSLDNEKTTTTVSGLAPVAWDDRFAPFFDKSDFELDIPGVGTFYNYVMPYSTTVNSPRWSLAIPVQASLSLNFAMFENMNRLRLDYEGGLLSHEKAKSQLERDVRKAYHNMLLLQENINLLRSSYANVERQVQMAQANYNAGLAPELTLLQAQVARENMRPVIDQAENGLRLSMAQFAMFLGLHYDTLFELEPVTGNIDFIPVDVAEMISKAASGKPDIQELRHTILMLESARKIQFFSLTPTLSLSWGITPVYIPDPLKEWKRSGALTISLGLRLHSLIPFSTDYQGIRNMDDQIRIANIGLAQMINGTEIEVYNTVLSLERTRTSAQAQAQTVRLAEQAYRLTEQAYQAGLQDYFQVQNAEQSLQQARVQMLEQQFNYLNSLIDLEYSIGVPFGTLSKRSN